MRIGIPANIEDVNSPVSDNFGRAAFYFIYDDKENRGEFIANTAAMSQGGAGIKAAQIIVDSGAGVVITPQMGENAAAVLKSAKMELYLSKEGSLMDNIKFLKDGQLVPLESIHQGYHGH